MVEPVGPAVAFFLAVAPRDTSGIFGTTVTNCKVGTDTRVLFFVQTPKFNLITGIEMIICKEQSTKTGVKKTVSLVSGVTP